jgi:hypothetical protein
VVFVGDPVAVGGQLGGQLLADGFGGAFLAKPLGDVLSGAAVAEVGHDLVDGRVVILELGDKRRLIQADGLPGERRDPAPGWPHHRVTAGPGRGALAGLRQSARRLAAGLRLCADGVSLRLAWRAGSPAL